MKVKNLENKTGSQKESQKTIGVILAGGIGERVGADIPKQLIKITGKTILEHSILAFEKSKYIDEILVMVVKGWKEKIGKLINGKYLKVSNILEGGKTRNDTTNNMIKYLQKINIQSDTKLVLHDAVRPLIDQRIIKNSVKALDKHKAIDVVIPSSDTIVEVDKNNIISGTPDRTFLRRGQTPQSFRFNILEKAYKKAKKDKNFFATDDCGVIFKYLPSVKIKCILGNESNIKITQPVDLFIADKLFQLKTEKIKPVISTQTSNLYKNKVIVVFGASYGIGKEIINLAKKIGAKTYGFSRSLNNVDITNKNDIKKALKSVYGKEKKIDQIVLTAGGLKIASINDVSFEEIEKMTRLNYISAINLAKISYNYLKETQGHLLLFASSSYTRGRGNYGLYSSAKAGIVNLSQSLSEEWAKDNIKINVINPARTATPMRKKAFGKEPISSLVSPKKVALFSIATMAGELTGQIIDVKKN